MFFFSPDLPRATQTEKQKNGKSGKLRRDLRRSGGAAERSGGLDRSVEVYCNEILFFCFSVFLCNSREVRGVHVFLFCSPELPRQKKEKREVWEAPERSEEVWGSCREVWGALDRSVEV